LAVFVPSNDTTSIHIANTFFALARHPHAWAKCREEVLALGSAPLTFEVLRGLKYVNWVLNESKLLPPPSPFLPCYIALTNPSHPIATLN
jgi:cytochrome P450 monooxygenase